MSKFDEARPTDRGLTITVPSDLGLHGPDGEVVAQFMLALGAVVQHSAYLEDRLRQLYCSLVGSKYAAVTAGGQDAMWLIESCKALVKAHSELRGGVGDELLDQLATASGLIQLRNRWVHGQWLAGELAAFVHRSSRKGGHRVEVLPVDLQAMLDATTALAVVGISVERWMLEQFKDFPWRLESQLRLEEPSAEQS